MRKYSLILLFLCANIVYGDEIRVAPSDLAQAFAVQYKNSTPAADTSWKDVYADGSAIVLVNDSLLSEVSEKYKNDKIKLDAMLRFTSLTGSCVTPIFKSLLQRGLSVKMVYVENNNTIGTYTTSKNDCKNIQLPSVLASDEHAKTAFETYSMAHEIQIKQQSVNDMIVEKIKNEKASKIAQIIVEGAIATPVVGENITITKAIAKGSIAEITLDTKNTKSLLGVKLDGEKKEVVRRKLKALLLVAKCNDPITVGAVGAGVQFHFFYSRNNEPYIDFTVDKTDCDLK